MKKVFILILSFLFVNQIGATNYTEKDTLNVFAINGLNLRLTNNLKSEKIGQAKYGEFVIIENTFDFTYKDTIQYRAGNWIKVNYKGKVGFVFDGYLSNLPVPKLRDPYEKEPYFRMRNYLKNHFQMIQKPIRIIEPYFDLDGKDSKGFEVSVWTGNLKLKEKGGYEWFEYSFYFEKTRFAEVISLFEILISQNKGYQLDFRNAISNYSPSHNLSSKSRKNSEIKTGDFVLVDGIRSKTLTFNGG